MIIGLGTDFLVYICWLGVLFLDLCFFSGILGTVMSVCCLLNWPTQLVCSQGMPADVGVWDAAKNQGCWRDGL